MPKSKIQSDLDFGDKNRKISGFETIEKSVDSARIPLGGGSEIRPEGQRSRKVRANRVSWRGFWS